MNKHIHTLCTDNLTYDLSRSIRELFTQHLQFGGLHTQHLQFGGLPLHTSDLLLTSNYTLAPGAMPLHMRSQIATCARAPC